MKDEQSVSLLHSKVFPIFSSGAEDAIFFLSFVFQLVV